MYYFYFKISSYDEPDALICTGCALAIIQAEKIIQKCQDTNKILIEQRNILTSHKDVLIKNESIVEKDEKPVRGEAEQHKSIDPETVNYYTQILIPKDAGLFTESTTKEQTTEIKKELQELPDLDTLEDSMFVSSKVSVNTENFCQYYIQN